MSDWVFKTIEVKEVNPEEGTVTYVQGEKTETRSLDGRAREEIGSLKKGRARAGFNPDGAIEWIRNEEAKKGSFVKKNSIEKAEGKPAYNPYENRDELIVKQNVLNRAVELAISGMKEEKVEWIKRTSAELYKFVTGKEW